VPLYNEDSQQLQTWERGKKFYGKISGLCARYSNIVGRTFEIERNGKAGDKETTYEIFPAGDADGTTVEDILDDLGIDNLPDPIGTIILNKTADEMESYLADGDFPSNSEAPRKRSQSSEEVTPRRRNRDVSAGRGDRF
jgi:hypothetical protein